MKVRSGFVSNSSSSSFCLYGTGIDTFMENLDYENKLAAIIELLQNAGTDLADNPSVSDVKEAVEELGDYEFCELAFSNFCCEYSAGVLGRNASDIKDDETGKQFKESVHKALTKYAKDDVIQHCEYLTGEEY